MDSVTNMEMLQSGRKKYFNEGYIKGQGQLETLNTTKGSLKPSLNIEGNNTSG